MKKNVSFMTNLFHFCSQIVEKCSQSLSLDISAFRKEKLKKRTYIFLTKKKTFLF